MIAQWENECILLSVLAVARVMIAQWENECISLSVLPMAQVMIAQWENECISLSVLPVARAMIAQWENECISLSVLPMARAMIAQWENECILLSALSAARVQLPAVAESFKGFFHTHTHILGDIVTNPLKGYEEYEATRQNSDSDTLWHRKMAAALSDILICHILQTVKGTYIYVRRQLLKNSRPKTPSQKIGCLMSAQNIF